MLVERQSGVEVSAGALPDDRTAGRSSREQPREDAQQRGLAGTVGSDQMQRAARFKPQIKPGEQETVAPAAGYCTRGQGSTLHGTRR